MLLLQYRNYFIPGESRMASKLIQHFGGGSKESSCCIYDILKDIFVNENLILIQIWMKCVPGGPIDNK